MFRSGRRHNRINWQFIVVRFVHGGDGHVNRWLPQVADSAYNSIMNVELDQLRKLPVADKLRIVEELWDDIGASDEPLVVRAWHKDEANRRANELEANPDIAITREELWKRVDKTNG